MVRKSRRNLELSPAADLEQTFPQILGIHERQATPGEKVADFMRLSREASGTEARTRRDSIATRLHAEAWPDHQQRYMCTPASNNWNWLEYSLWGQSLPIRVASRSVTPVNRPDASWVYDLSNAH